MKTYRKPLHIRATWAKVTYDDMGGEYLEAITHDLLVGRSALLKEDSAFTATFLVRATLLFKVLREEGWHLVEVQYSKPGA